MHSMNDYSSAIQLRSDRWSALREAASGLTRATTAKETEALRSKCAALFDSLSLIEPYHAGADNRGLSPSHHPAGTRQHRS
jgi:arginine decarboxylase